MARKSYLRLQCLPGIPNYRQSRNPASYIIHEHDNPEEILELMEDSLLAAAAEHNAVPWEITPAEDYPEALTPLPGRCLWNWASVIEGYEDIDKFDIEPLLTLALRPSTALPEKMKSLTPRFCTLLAGMRKTELIVALNHLVDKDILRYGYSYSADISKAFLTQGYGSLLDAEVDATQPCPEPYKASRNSRMTAEQEYSLTRGSPLATTATCTLTDPPIIPDLIPGLHIRYDRAVRWLKERAAQAVPTNFNRKFIDHVRKDDLEKYREDVLHHYFAEEWDTSQVNNMRLPVKEHVKYALVRAMVQVDKRRRDKHYQSAFGAPILAGISPAVVVRESISVLKRTGLSFLDETMIQDFIDSLTVLTPSSIDSVNHNRDELILEIDDLLQDFMDVKDTTNPDHADDIWRAANGESFPAWGLYGKLDV